MIMEQAKKLFGEAGFAATSVSDVATACELPVGSIYTYFTNKEELVRAIVEEGWNDLRARLHEALATEESIEEKLELLVGTFFPELLADSDLITILLSEAVEFTGLEEKINELVELFEGILMPLIRSRPQFEEYRRSNLEAALMVYFLGTLEAVRITRASSLNVKPEDIIGFLRMTIQNVLGLKLNN